MSKKPSELASYQVLGGTHALLCQKYWCAIAPLHNPSLLNWWIWCSHCKGPLFTFTISGKERYHDVFDRWMLRLSMNLLSYVTVELTTGPKYKIPSSLVSIGLEHLYLKNCIISLPWVFQGFDLLTVLDLDIFSTTDKDINNLISCCPMLSMLRLCSCEGIKCLNI